MTDDDRRAFQTRYDPDDHMVFVVAPTGECYRFTIPEALDFAHGLMTSAALCAGEDEDAREIFRAGIDGLNKRLDEGKGIGETLQ